MMPRDMTRTVSGRRPRGLWLLALGVALVALGPVGAQHPEPAPFEGEVELQIRDGRTPAPARRSAADAAAAEAGEALLQPGAESTLFLEASDHIAGALLKLEAERLYWSRPDLQEPAAFLLDKVSFILNRPSAEPSASATRVELFNGDRFPGELIRIDADTVVLQTEYAGAISFPRRSVARIRTGRQGNEGGLFDGRDLEQDFRKVSGDWKLEDGALTGMGGIIFRVPSPPRARIRVDVSWTGERPNFSVISHVGDSNYNHYGYNLYVNGEQVQLNRGTRYQFGNAAIEALPAKQARIEMEVDQQEGLVTALVNGRKVQTWQTRYNSNQNFIAFTSNNEASTFRNLRITPLDMRDEALDQIDTDRVSFGDGDRVSGQVQTLAAGVVALGTAYGDLQIPVDALGEIAFDSTQYMRARRYGHDVLLHLPGGGRITTAVDRIDGGKLQGYSENTGDLTLDLHYVSRIDFHIYRERKDADDVGLDGDAGPGQGAAEPQRHAMPILMPR